MTTALFILVGFLGLMILGMPIGYSMLVTAILTLKTFHEAIPLSIVPQRIFAGVNNFILLCIPFFMLAGEMMAITPLFEKLIKLFRAFLGHIKGGLSHVNIVVSMFFAGITGAATADTSAVGGLLIPAMEKDGYTRSYATAVTVSSSTIGVIIPPSNLMIVAALATSSSVAVLFMAGLVPGILSGLGQLVVSLIYAKRKGFPSAHRMSWRDRVQVFWAGIPAIGIPVIIFGGILGGVFTPTEAAAMTVFYAVIVGIFLLRSFPSWALLYKTLLTVVQRLGAVMLAVGAAMVLGWIFAIAQVPMAVGNWITSVTTNPVLITLGMLATFLIIGTFLDPPAGHPDLYPHIPADCHPDRHGKGPLYDNHGVRFCHRSDYTAGGVLSVCGSGDKRIAGRAVSAGSDTLHHRDLTGSGADRFFPTRCRICTEFIV